MDSRSSLLWVAACEGLSYVSPNILNRILNLNPTRPVLVDGDIVKIPSVTVRWQVLSNAEVAAALLAVGREGEKMSRRGAEFLASA